MALHVAGELPAMAANRPQARTTATPKPPGDAVQPRVQGVVQVLASTRLADRGALEDEQRDRQQRDAGQLLVDVLRDGIERRGRHEHQHEHGRDAAQREGDRHAGEQGDDGGGPVEEAGPATCSWSVRRGGEVGWLGRTMAAAEDLQQELHGEHGHADRHAAVWYPERPAPRAEGVVCPSSSASNNRAQLFQAKKTTKAKLRKSASQRRTRSAAAARSGRARRSPRDHAGPASRRRRRMWRRSGGRC